MVRRPIDSDDGEMPLSDMAPTGKGVDGLEVCYSRHKMVRSQNQQVVPSEPQGTKTILLRRKRNTRE